MNQKQMFKNLTQSIALSLACLSVALATAPAMASSDWNTLDKDAYTCSVALKGKSYEGRLTRQISQNRHDQSKAYIWGIHFGTDLVDLLTEHFGRSGFDYSSGFETTVRDFKYNGPNKLSPIKQLDETRRDQWYDTGVPGNSSYNMDVALHVNSSLELSYDISFDHVTLNFIGKCQKVAL